MNMEYVSLNDIAKFDKFKETDDSFSFYLNEYSIKDNSYFYKFNDSKYIPYHASDNIFMYKINNNNFIFYNKLDWNSGVVVFYGKKNYKSFLTSATSTYLRKLSDKIYLFKLLENVDFTINKTTYFLLNENLDNGIKNKISFISEGAYMLPEDTITFHNIRRTVVFSVKDSISSSSIFLNIMYENGKSEDTIKIENDKFIVSDYLNNLMWDSTKIVINSSVPAESAIEK